MNFDEFAPDYRAVHDRSLRGTGYTSAYFARRKIREMARALAGDRPARILDFGCGDGLTTAELRGRFPSAELHGIDVSRGSVAEARARAVPGARFEAYDGGEIPFPRGFFDAVLVANVLHHVGALDRVRACLGRLRGVLAPGGRIFVFEHNPLNPVTRRVVRTCPFDADAHLLSAWRLRRLLAAEGLALTCRFIIFFPFIREGMERIEDGLARLPLGGQYYVEARAPGEGAGGRPGGAP